MATRSRSRAGRGRQVSAGSRVRASVMPSRSARPVAVVSGSSSSPSAGIRLGAIWRASSIASGRETMSGRATGVRISCPIRSMSTATTSSPSVRSLMAGSSAVLGRARDTSKTVTPCRPPALSWPSSEAAPPSTMTSTCGRSTSGSRSRENQDRPARSSARSSSTAAISRPMRRSGPEPSVRVGCWAWGTHLSQSHSCAPVSSAQTAMRSSVGACQVRACTTMPRSSSRRASRGPSRVTRAKERMARATARSGTTPLTRVNRRRAAAESGSTSSSGWDSGSCSSSASCWLPVPMRTVAKSGSCGRRSHSRSVAARDSSANGSGCTQLSASRCSTDAARARRRTWDRWRM